MGISSSAGTIKNRILSASAGTIFTSVDFADVTENSRIGVVLSRLEDDGVIHRITRGVYYKPVYNKFLNEYLAPTPTLVAEVNRNDKHSKD